MGIPFNLHPRIRGFLGAGLSVALVACGGSGGEPTAEATEATRTAAAVRTVVTEAPTPDLTPAALGGSALPAVAAASAARPAPGQAEDEADASTPAQSSGPTMRAMAAQAATTAVVLHVAPNGNDSWSGTLATANAGGTDGPVRSLTTAQARARAHLAAMGSNRTALRVLIQPGTYALTSTLNFDASDSGAPGAAVSYEAVTPGTVIISGAMPLIQTTAMSGTTPVRFNSPSNAGMSFDGGGQLIVNGRRAVLARSPNAGQFYFIEKAIPLASEPVGQEGRTAFRASTAALNTVAALGATDRSRAIVNVMHAWTSSHHRIAPVAPAGGLQLATPANWTFLIAGTSQRYWIENIGSALDAPGEFLWDESGVRYIPLTSELSGTLNVALPVLERLISVKGNLDARKWVDSLQFRGLTFAHTRAQTPTGGFSDPQAAVNIGAAVEVDGALNFLVDNCKFTTTAGYGVWLRRAVRSGHVTNSRFDDMGAGAIKLGQSSQWAGDPLQTGNNYAVNNIVGNTGKLFPGAVGIWVGQSWDNKVRNNLIYNTTYSGISVGWSWGFDSTTSGRNTIEDNLLVNIGMGEMSDMGGIYTVGVSPGTAVMGNVIREVRGYPGYGAGAWGMYGDSGTSQVNFFNNIVLGADNGTFQVTLSRANTVQYNLLGWGDRMDLHVQHPDPQTALNFTKNVLVPKAVKPFVGVATAPYVDYSANEVSSTFVGQSPDLSMCGAGCAGSVATVNATTDPRGVVLVSTNTSMVNRVSVVAAKVGPTTLPNASSVVTVATQKPPVVVAPPITFELDIANTPIGTQPLGFWYSAPGNAASVGVVANPTAPNGRCLRYADAVSNVNSYDPHTYASMNHASGITTGEFDLFIDSNTFFEHQWRDNAIPKKTGPALQVKATGVYVNNVLVAPVSVGQWMKFKVTAPLANTGTTWTLQVTNAAGVVTTRSGLPFMSAGWNTLSWWGFISQARVATNFCLASVKATNVQ